MVWLKGHRGTWKSRWGFRVGNRAGIQQGLLGAIGGVELWMVGLGHGHIGELPVLCSGGGGVRRLGGQRAGGQRSWWKAAAGGQVAAAIRVGSRWLESNL